MITIKNVIILLGNGFSIDLVHKIGKADDINLFNLFQMGDRVPWPADMIPGFLSKSHCPNLWTLGARPTSNNTVCNKLIEDIISCANFDYKSLDSRKENVYVKAYYELVAYLRYLFIYYNNIIIDDDINRIIRNWGWSLFIESLHNNADIDSITFIVYNYDILLERVLKCMALDYKMIGFGKDDKKIRIIKPHGSISFRSKVLSTKDIFDIRYNIGVLGGPISDLEFDEDVSFSKLSSINTMIPPAGQSSRYNSLWSSALQNEVETVAKSCKEDDDVILGGLSYCSVDRNEIDAFLKSLNPASNVTIVNPDIDNTICAVISSRFDKYTHYTCSDILGGIK